MGVFKRWIPSKKGKTAYWYIRYTVNKKPKWESIGKVGEVTKAVADAILAERKKQIRLGTYEMMRATIPTLKEFSDEYLDYVKNVKKKRSWEKDRVILRHMNIYFKNKNLTDINPKDIDKYKEYMLDNGYKPASVNRELSCLKYLFNLAKRWKKFFGNNPVAEVEFLEEGEGITRILTLEEEDLLLKESPTYLKNIIITALNTGMRKMEILSLKWENVDLEKNNITINQTNTKSKKTRIIPISSYLRKILLEQKLLCGGSEYVYPNDSGEGHITDIKRSFSTACKKAEITGFRFHDLRHTAGTRMIESGVNVVLVSKILGHSDINLTVKRYIHPEESLRDAVERLANQNFQ